tara:strand:- start:47 stop:379 length:333 start_codon:yes stop_codon:yes gene_type:complete
MAYHFISTVKNERKDSFRLFAGKKCKYISLIGETSLSTATHPYARMYEASYYLNIIANETYSQLDNLVKKLKAKALKLQPHMRDYEEYDKTDELEYHKRMQDHPKYYNQY